MVVKRWVGKAGAIDGDAIDGDAIDGDAVDSGTVDSDAVCIGHCRGCHGDMCCDERNEIDERK